MIRCQKRGQPDMFGENMRRKRRKIICIHPGREVLEDVGLDARTERGQGGEEAVAIDVRVWHDCRGVYPKAVSLYRKNCASIMRRHGTTLFSA